jgi:hypothetical protein
MDALPHFSVRRERGVALIIVLAFIVLLTGLAVAYLSRATSDRQVAHASFNQTKVDQVAASGMDLIIGGLRQEITDPNASTATTINGVTIYTPVSPANMLPLRSGNPGGAPDPIPNLVRRSVYPDTIPAPPGVSSLASAVNSTTNISANGRSISLARWNKHYLIPQANIGTLTAPDWVIVTRGPRPGTTAYPVAFSGWEAPLADRTLTNNLYAVGRYAYAIYDEGGLLDANVAGYPTGTTADQSGRKGPVAFAALGTLPNPIPQTQTDKLVGWRNYGSIQPPASFGPFPNFTFTAALATNYVNNFVLHNTTGFTTVGTNTANGQTDQVFGNRQQLIAFQQATGFSADALQYLGTFLRELNAPTWKPSTPTTPSVSSIDYATLANTPTADTSTAINRDLLAVRVPAGGTFTRSDGTTATAGDLLLKQRFPLSRINGLGPTGVVTTTNSTISNGFLVPATDPATGGGTISRDFGLHWNTANNRWDYVGATGTTVQTTIKTLDQVAAANREPNFFELLKAGILSGSVGMGSGTGNVRTFVNAETKYYSTPLSSDYQIMQIGANIIDQWDSDNVPTFIGFKDPVTATIYEIAGIENLPYLNKLVFKPHWTSKTTGSTTTYTFNAWLLPSLWNPHQNAPGTGTVQIAMTTGTMTVNTTSPILGPSSPVSGGSNQNMTVDAAAFGTSPSAPTTANPAGASKIDNNAPGNYYGFHFPVLTVTAPAGTGVPTGTAYPTFTGCEFAMQVQVNGNWKSYQKWTGCLQPATPLVCAPGIWFTGTPPTLVPVTTYQDPEFVTLDPRTLRFGVWGNAANQPGASPSDLNTGVLTTLEVTAGTYEAITALPPQGTGLSLAAGPPYPLYNYAKNLDATTHYTDLDTLQRQGDIISSATTAMLPGDFVDRPQILNRPFQSLAELGQVFRDQPWKTLDFGDFVAATAPGPDAGLLDIFSLHEASMEAGKTSLNTRQKPVLTAILSAATKRLADGTTAINTTQRNQIVDALVALQPMVRKTDFLTGLAGNATVTGLGTKEARELVIRAFSDALQTRTWNLLIDVVAQSGRYPASASTLAGFLVEGEQHYWVHVAIDRFTGQVIDKQIEVVNE